MKSTSFTAIGTTFVRSVFKNNKCDDYLANSFLLAPLTFLSVFLRRIALLRKLFIKIVNKIDPGILEYLSCRNGFMDEALELAITKGFKQIVVLGAGYDSRAIRFSREHVRFFEVDHPNTQSKKNKKLYREHKNNTQFVSVDFAKEDLEEKLLSSGFDPTIDSFFIWEGVTMFLTKESVIKTLRSLKKLSHGKGELVVDFLYPKSKRAGTKCTAANSVGEPCTFTLDPTDLPFLVSEPGWSVNHIVETEELRKKYGSVKELSSEPIKPMSYIARLK